MSEVPANPKPARWLAVLLVVLPLWLVGSGVFAIYRYFKVEERKEVEQQRTFARMVSAPSIRDDLRKFVEIIGERHTTTPETGQNLTRAAAMIEGTLGPSNTGFNVRRVQGPAGWPILTATLPGSQATRPAIWVVASYDSHPGSPGAEANATGLAAVLAAAQALAGDRPLAAVHFAFLPHANDPDGPRADTAARFAQLARSSAAILCVEAMGAGETLLISSRDPEALSPSLVSGLGTIAADTPQAPPGLAALLANAGLPAIRVATRKPVQAAEADSEIPAAATVAAATGRLIQLIRRHAAGP